MSTGSCIPEGVSVVERGKSRFITYRIRILFFLYVIVTVLLLILFAGAATYHVAYLPVALSGVIIYSAVLYGSYRWIYQPYRRNKRILQLFINGYTLNGDSAVYISPEVEGIMAKFKEMVNTNELISVSKKQAQFLALQNQINPHFLYNTLEGIRGEALVAGLDSAAEMTEALSTFFRYTISNVEHLVTLEDELTNIENYYIIQQYRFGERLNLSIEIDPEEEAIVLQYRLPKLTLQPIVENAVYHGIEMKVGKGTVRIKVETTPKRLILIISDDGLGMEEDTLEELNQKLNHSSFDYVKPESEEKGGIALVNVNRRIQLLFGEEYGLNVYSRRNVGTDVEITLPLIQKE
jgi:two-component system sensor histidine kinase YesM